MHGRREPSPASRSEGSHCGRGGFAGVVKVERGCGLKRRGPRESRDRSLQRRAEKRKKKKKLPKRAYWKCGLAYSCGVVRTHPTDREGRRWWCFMPSQQVTFIKTTLGRYPLSAMFVHIFITLLQIMFESELQVSDYSLFAASLTSTTWMGHKDRRLPACCLVLRRACGFGGLKKRRGSSYWLPRVVGSPLHGLGWDQRE